MNSIEFKRTRTVKDYILSSSFIIIGFCSMYFSSNISVDMFGAVSIITGIILLLTVKSGHRNPETGLVYNLKMLYFSKETKETILSALKAGDLRSITDKSNKSTNLRLDLYSCPSDSKVYCTLNMYIPYEYEPCSQQCALDKQSVAHLLK